MELPLELPLEVPLELLLEFEISLADIEKLLNCVVVGVQIDCCADYGDSEDNRGARGGFYIELQACMVTCLFGIRGKRFIARTPLLL